MWKLHILSVILLVLKYGAGYTIPLWLAVLPSYIYPLAIFTVLGLGILTGRIVMMGLREKEEKDNDNSGR